MCRRIVCLLALVLVLSLDGLVQARLTKDPSIVLYYSFDAFSDLVIDQSPNGRDGMISGDVVADPEGISKGSARFADGGFIDLDGPSFAPQDVPITGMTIAAWAKCENTGGDHAIFNARASDSTWLIHPELRSSGQFRWLLRAAGGTTIFDIRAGEVTWDEWLHYAGLYDKESAMASLYINGELVSDQAISTASDIAGDWGNGARVGRNVDNARPFTGLMDIFCIFKRALLPAEIQEVMLGIPPGVADEPSPDTEAVDVPLDAVLGWAPGQYAPESSGHTLYLSEDFTDVNDGMGGIVLDANSYTPEQGLDYGKTYYWRVDEVNGAPDYTVYEGDIWRFTTEPFAYPVENITATASGSQANMGPEKTIDGAGLDASDGHSTMASDMWLSDAGVQPAWIQYEFDKAYQLHEIWVWNSNQLIEAFLGLGAKDVSIETSLDGTDWTPLAEVVQLAQATGQAGYTHNTIVSLGAAMAKFVRITVDSGWGLMPQYGLSEVRFLYVPTFARNPEPVDGSSVDQVDVALGWRAGREAASHQVYLGTDATDLALVATTPENAYTAAGLSFSTTYYWSVTEVNDSAAVSSYAGDIWSFTTPDFGIVDDFDQYDDTCNRIFFAWEDGLGHNGGEDVDDCEVPPSNGNGGGSIVGNAQAPFGERSTVNVGSTQSLPLSYDNAFGPSESTLVLGAQDWTASEVQTLSLFFYGQPDNMGQLYAKINSTKVVYDGDIAQAQWQQWNIDLTSLAGLQTVTQLSIGVDGASAAGMLYIDDIRLYP
jgi:hypothetical protein